MDIQTVACPLLHNLSEQTNYGQAFQIGCFRFAVKQAVCSDSYTTKHLVRDTLRPDETADNLPYEKVGNNKPVCIANEVPFDIPDSWEWVRLKDIAYVNGGFAFKSTNFTDTGIRVIRISDFNETGFINNKIVRHFFDSSLEQFLLEEKNILLCMTGGTVGKSLFVTKMNEPMVTNQRVATIKIFGALEEYVNLVILSPITQKVINNSKNSTNDNISMDTINNLFVPIPPHLEQIQIVNKFKYIEEFIQKYNAIEERLKYLNNSFPDLLKKSILQEAVQGKLVPQDPNDEPASVLLERIRAEKQALVKAGKIKKDKHESVIFRRDNSHYEKLNGIERCIDDEIPFDIPDNWCWVRLGTLFQHNTGKALNSSNKIGTKLTYITTSNLYWDKFVLDRLKEMPFTDAEVEKCTVIKGDLLVCEGGDIGRAAIWNYDFPMRIQNHIHRLRSYIPVNVKFCYYIFYLYKHMGLIGGKGIGIQGLSSNAIHQLLFPLPPSNEQHKIVEKIEALLPFCENL